MIEAYATDPFYFCHPHFPTGRFTSVGRHSQARYENCGVTRARRDAAALDRFEGDFARI
jgi:hypothetical protein